MPVKKIENRAIFRDDMDKSLPLTFWPHHNSQWSCLQWWGVMLWSSVYVMVLTLLISWNPRLT